MNWETILAGAPSLGIIFFLWKEGIITFNLKKKNGGNVSHVLATIKDNHLDHIQQDLNELRRQQEIENAAHASILIEQRATNEKLDRILLDGVRIRIDSIRMPV